MDKKVKVTMEARSEPQLRKLARALISLAQRKLEAEASDDEHITLTGDAA